MKKWIIVAALATAILASCTKNEVRVDAPDQAISFTTAVGATSTKAMITGEKYPTDESFGTYAFYLPTGQSWLTSEGQAAAQLYIPQSEVDYTDNTTAEGYDWTTKTPYYWPTAGSLTFFSFSPWSIYNKVTCSVSDNGIKITEWDVHNNQDIDVMVADLAADLTGNTVDAAVGADFRYNGVSTVFRHKLSQIVAFQFNTDKDYTNTHSDGSWANGDKQIIVTGISISNITTKGTFSSTLLPSSTSLGEWSGHTEGKNYTWYNNTTGTPIAYNNNGYTTTIVPDGASVSNYETVSKDNGYLLVLPQFFSDNDTQVITLNYTIRTYTGSSTYVDDKVTRNIPLYDIHGAEGFLMNKKITYNFTVGLNQIYWAPSVVDWESTGKVNLTTFQSGNFKKS